MKTIPFEELAEFIRHQTPTRLVNMTHSAAGESYGCVLVHFAHAIGFPLHHVGMSILFDEKPGSNNTKNCIQIDNSYNFIALLIRQPADTLTYAQVQILLDEYLTKETKETKKKKK